MNVGDLLLSAQAESRRRVYFVRIEVLDLTTHLVKLRMYVSTTLFVQLYRNDRFNTTNMALIHNDQRVYARDELGGAWHRHPVAAQNEHDTSPEGRRAVTLEEFLDEVEDILAQFNLP
jgi:hypothetical protein